jgi:tripartite ATP-independent transporter DctP family solute receptor
LIRQRVLVAILTVLLVSGTALGAPIVIKFANTVAPDHPNHVAAERFAELVASRTDKIEVQVFPAAQLGSEKDLLEGTMFGGVDMFQVSPGAVSLIQPEFAVLDCPYIFRDVDHLERVLHSEVMQPLYDKLEANRGIKVLDAFWYYGTRHLTTKDKPIYKPEDLAGMLIRAPEQPIYLETVKAMGATATPVDFADLYLALKQGTVDGQENPVATIYTYKYYEAQKYLMLTGHMIRTIVVGINADLFDSLSPDLQEILVESLLEAGQYNKELMLKAEEELLVELQNLGMVIVEPDVEAFREATKVVAEIFEDKWGRDLYEAIVNYQ